ncbi:MAG: chemotaxis protein CheW [Pseudomonadota bacterium]
MERAKPEDKSIRIILFKVSGENWGLGFHDVQEVFEGREITPVPKAPPFIPGIVNLRGKIITVIDLALLIGAPQTKEETSKILCLRSDEMNIGLLVGSTIAIESLTKEPAEHEDLLKEGITEHEPILKRRMVRKGKDQINLLDGNNIITWLDHYHFN